jgi:hypothetical protein
VGIGLRDPRSQKRDLGHPSISPFDVAEGTSFVVSLRTRLSESAPRDDKGKGDGSLESGCCTEASSHWMAHRPVIPPVEVTILFEVRVGPFVETFFELSAARLIPNLNKLGDPCCYPCLDGGRSKPGPHRHLRGYPGAS